MMLPSHLFATLLVCGLVALVRPLAPRHWLLALAFGVGIDVDHLLQMPTYLATHGAAQLTPAAMLAWGGAWQGFMHTPWALLPVAAAMLHFRSVAPAVAWSLHMVLDFGVARHLVVWGSGLEWAVAAALGVGVVLVLWAQHRAHGRGAPFARHLAATMGVLRR